MVYEVIIVGSGPAGLTAAIYSARAQLKTLVVAGLKYGGQLMTTTLVENYPGFSKGIMGPQLMQEMLDQAKNQGAEVVFKDVEKVELGGEIKRVFVDGVWYESKVVILSMGADPKILNVPGELELWAKGVSSCATCDGAFFKDKEVAVIGGGDSAMEEALFLTRFATKVYVIHRRDSFRASKVMQERVLSEDKIEVIWNSEVRRVNGHLKVESLTLFNNKEGIESELKVEGMFLAIGHLPNSTLVSGQLEVDEGGYIKVKDHTHTSVDGVFVAGDVHDHHYKQAVTAAGMGCMAAIDAEKWLSSRGD